VLLFAIFSFMEGSVFRASIKVQATCQEDCSLRTLENGVDTLMLRTYDGRYQAQSQSARKGFACCRDLDPLGLNQDGDWDSGSCYFYCVANGGGGEDG